jgi:phosphoglycolate phosphatase-like HAD superfamily hydrolase
MEIQKKISAKALLIDLDGTLVNPTQALLEAATAGFIAIGATTYDPQIGIEIAKRMEQNIPVQELFSLEQRKPQIIKKFLRAYIDAYYMATINKATPILGVYETLQTLSKTTPLALVTLRSIPKKQITKELAKLKLLTYFKAVITTLDVKKPKPHPEAIIKAAQQLGVSAHNCAIIGDSTIDVQAGKAANAKTIAVLTGLYTRQELEKEKPDLIIPDINKLPIHLQPT